jgi:hypothetical protein
MFSLCTKNHAISGFGNGDFQRAMQISLLTKKNISFLLIIQIIHWQSKSTVTFGGEAGGYVLEILLENVIIVIHKTDLLFFAAA